MFSYLQCHWHLISKLLRGQLAKWVPPALLGASVTPEIEAGWEKAVTMVLPQLVEDLDQTLQSGGPEEAYIAITEEWEWYGAVFFKCAPLRVVQSQSSPAVPPLPGVCTCAVTRDGLSVYEPTRQPRLRLFHKRQLRRWHASGRVFRFEYELDDRQSEASTAGDWPNVGSRDSRFCVRLARELLSEQR